LIAVIAVCGMSGVASADMITYSLVDGGNNTLTTPFLAHPSVIVEDFDSALNFSWAGNYRITTGTLGDQASPWSELTSARDTTKYMSVPDNFNTTPAVAVAFGASYDYLGLFWGSMDTYNTLQLYDGDTLVKTIVGADVAIPGASGAQELPGTNRYVNIFLTPGVTFDNAVITSTKYAFEFDNVAVGYQVPVPGAVLLGILGLSAAGIKLRRFA